MRGFCDVGIALAGLVLLVVAFLMFAWTFGLLTYATMTVELPRFEPMFLEIQNQALIS